MTEVVSSILGPLVEKLASSSVEEIQLVWGVKDDREKLKSKLEMIQAVLADAEQKQTKEDAVRLWLSKLKDFCYDAEDVLDEFEARALWRRARSTEHLTLKRKVRYLSSWPSNFIFQFKMAHKMKELRTRLDEINEEKTKFNLSSDVHEKTIVLQRETYSFVPASKVIGRKEEKKKIIELLIRSDDGGADLLEGVSEGSKVIVTSRNKLIAPIMGTVPRLNWPSFQEDSLTLFVKYAFNPGKEKNHPDLMNYQFNNFDLIQLWISSGLIQSSGNNQELEEIGWRYLEELRSRSFFDAVEDVYHYPLLSFRMHDLIYELAISVAQTESSNMKVWTQDISPTTRHISFPNPSGVPKDELSRCLSKLSRVRTIISAFPGEGNRMLDLSAVAIDCKNLEALFDDIQSLASLRSLFIGCCPKLASLPQGIKNLKALEELWICGCHSLKLPVGESNEPRSMSRLQSFAIGEVPEIVSLPVWLEGSASTLQAIGIANCPNLSVLPEWLRNCSSLRTLQILHCPGLSSLPDGVCRIPTLTKLQISGCGKFSSCGEEEEDDQN
ncbi:hypothetical protein NL676_016711 [Syzygium grande]|nr:hypothetical protein NL676_016711 [Syzygium grande]